MGKLWIAGLGPGEMELLTQETLRIIERADKVILRTEIHPAASGLKAKGIEYTTCDRFYESGDSFEQIYANIADYIIAEARAAINLCYCVPGHPLVAEDTVRRIRQMLGETAIGVTAEKPAIELQVLSAVSFLDSVFVTLGIDPLQEKLSVLDAALLWEGDYSIVQPLPAGSCLFAQVYDQLVAGELKLALLEEVPPDAEVQILYHAGIIMEEKLIRCPLAELDHFTSFDHLTSVYLPDFRKNVRANQTARYPLDKLMEVFRRLLGPDGCPWDIKQTHASLKPYLLEEANEVLEAIDEKDMAHLKEELGDVLMQIVFHCTLTEKNGDFDMNDVIDGITEKMIRRHPHVFGDEKAENPEEVKVLWQKIKNEEKRASKM